MTRENTKITCPDCRGALERISDGSILQYRCRVGHTYSALTAVAAHIATEENTLWAAVVALDEAADLYEDVANTLPDNAGHELTQAASVRRELGKRVRDILHDLRAPKLL